MKPQYVNLRLMGQFSEFLEKRLNRTLRDQEVKSMERERSREFEEAISILIYARDGPESLESYIGKGISSD